MNSTQTVLFSMYSRRTLIASRYPRRDSRALSRVILLFTTVFIFGCSPPQASEPKGDYYYLNPSKRLSTVGRVTIIELGNNSSYPQISSDITKTLYQALQKKQVFGLTVVRRQDPSWRSLQLDGVSPYNLNQIKSIREVLKCDGLLVGTITEFRPYPHMAVGLCLKLLDLRDGQLLWALEQVWDSGDKTFEVRIQDYFKTEKRSGYAPLDEQLAVISPIEFIRFVSYEVAETL